MVRLIEAPATVEAAGNKPKIIKEFIGRVNTATEGVSIAHMTSPAGWVEPGQRPDFDEYTVVLQGTLRVDFEGGHVDVRAGQAVIAPKGQWVRYSTEQQGAQYVAICMPAFSIDTVNRDAE